jgi:tellurite resistance protein TerA
MDNILTKGGNIPWPHPQATLEVAGLSAGGSVLAFLVTTTGKVRNDDDFVFFNNPDVPGVTIAGQIATIDLEKVAGEIDRIVIAAVQDDADPEPLSASPLQVTVDPTGLVVPVTGLSSERAVVLVEMYRRAQQWKIRSVSAGWTEGFSALVRAHGVEVDDDAGTAVPDSTATAAPVAEPPPTPSTLDLRKPGVDAIDLGKRTGTINLRKGQQVTITKTARIVATCTWPRATDYDIYALVSYRDGRCETVSTFGTAGNERDFQLATTDGAVRHSGDVGRTQSRGWRKKTAEVGQETIQISLNPEVRAVLPVVYSAQSNGTGSFRKYQVSMAIDNGSGDTVTIDAGNASDDDMVFSCVPGIIINDPDGVRIQFLELYSSAGSEQRPAIGADLIVQMDVGPVNAFK